MTTFTTIKLRRGTAQEWETANPILALGEMGYETDRRRSKVGDGETAWNDLLYVSGSDLVVNAKSFGAVGDGSTDDTAALQNWIDHVVTNKNRGWLPNGTYKITSTLVVPGGTYGWSLEGENENYTVIKQYTDNTPVLQIGSTTTDSVHTVTVRRLMLTYNTPQPATNTNAICLLFSAPNTYSTAYWSTFENIQFWNGYYAMKSASGTRSPWACRFDMLTSYAQSGGFLDDSATYTAGIPNNIWGRATIDCHDSAGPIFKNWRGYNTSVGTIEFLRADKGPKLIVGEAGFTADIGALKVEVGNYTGAGTNLFEFAGGSSRIGSIHVSLVDVTPTSGYMSIISCVGNAKADLEVGYLLAVTTGTASGTCVAVNGGATDNFYIRSVDLGTGGWTLTNPGSTLTANTVTVERWANGRLSKDKGDANYTVALGDPNVVQFKTAFTAQRTITLPAASSADLFAGLYYDIIFDGAINGSNTAVIKHGSTTLRTQTTDKQRLRYQWIRSDSGAQWVLVDLVDISGNTMALGSSNSNILAQSLRAPDIISGGGTVAVDASGYVSWSSRYTVIADGKGSSFAPTGYFHITCPTSGTITGVGGAANRTATAAGIPLDTNGWEALYYILPVGTGSVSQPENFRVVAYSEDVEIPHTWVPICVRNYDNGVFSFPHGINLRAGESFNTSGLVSQRVSVPASANAAGTTGQWALATDGSYAYFCTAANTWKRVAIATW